MSETRIAELEQRVKLLEVEMERLLITLPIRKAVMGIANREYRKGDVVLKDDGAVMKDGLPLDPTDYSKGVEAPPEIV